ncbi:OLC1v1022815C1 [Oldenlandia corymbosa var. corymbosa]|uniref:OLC1v1022815C1 n=1 Tax=Oldenlandia corymbosa var. corymbosa TaxID=529605 RepID=A0AAV1C1B8_OLDCO|nr:OLC1v1022815C1 [Oldenlandia corymbosa var. corymbosa]
MAKANLRSSIKAFHVFGLLFLVLLVQKGNAFQFKVGGSNGWAPPADPNSNSHNQWAEQNRFQIGDSLLFEYSGNSDSVLYVNKDDYTNCNTDKPIQKFTDGHTVFKFEHSGPYYFISGVKDNCLKNEKLVIVVLADRSHRAPPPSNETATSPPSPTPTTSPSPSPPAEAPSPPSPAPTSEGSSPSPPANPTPAPSQQSSPPHKNGASSILTSFFATMGAFAGSSLLLFF